MVKRKKNVKYNKAKLVVLVAFASKSSEKPASDLVVNIKALCDPKNIFNKGIESTDDKADIKKYSADMMPKRVKSSGAVPIKSAR
mgnify:FL=1